MALSANLGDNHDGLGNDHKDITLGNITWIAGGTRHRARRDSVRLVTESTWKGQELFPRTIDKETILLYFVNCMPQDIMPPLARFGKQSVLKREDISGTLTLRCCWNLLMSLTDRAWRYPSGILEKDWARAIDSRDLRLKATCIHTTPGLARE